MITDAIPLPRSLSDAKPPPYKRHPPTLTAPTITRVRHDVNRNVIPRKNINLAEIDDFKEVAGIGLRLAEVLKANQPYDDWIQVENVFSIGPKRCLNLQIYFTIPGKDKSDVTVFENLRHQHLQESARIQQEMENNSKAHAAPPPAKWKAPPPSRSNSDDTTSQAQQPSSKSSSGALLAQQPKTTVHPKAKANSIVADPTFVASNPNKLNKPVDKQTFAKTIDWISGSQPRCPLHGHCWLVSHG